MFVLRESSKRVDFNEFDDQDEGEFDWSKESDWIKYELGKFYHTLFSEENSFFAEKSADYWLIPPR